VEVTVSLAIASLGFVTLMGLLPQGLDMMRKTSEMSVGAKVIQKITGELQSTAWEDIKWTGYGPPRFFSNEGVEIPADKLHDPSAPYGMLAYVASVYIPVSPPNAVLPALTGDSSSSYVKPVKVCVATSTNPNFNFETAKSFRMTTYSVMIAKMKD
jgi:uncharacterized protein (TIGR02598 family)